MSNKLLNLIKIRPTVFSLIIVLISSIVIITLSLQYYFSQELALKASKVTYEKISQKLENEIESLDKNQNNLISMFEIFDNISFVPSKNKRHPLLKLITNAIKHNNYIYALYVGKKNGDFYEVINLDNSEKVREKYKATPNMKWVIIKITTKNNKKIKLLEYLDKDFKQLKSITKTTNYNPSMRPWYKKAIQNKKVIKTDPYIFANLKSYGITYAKKLNNKGDVLAIDISLESISKFLAHEFPKQDNKTFLFKENGEIISSIHYDSKGKLNSSQTLTLNNKETKFIKNNTINVSNENDWPPFDYAYRGQAMGYSIDVLNLISKNTGLKINYVNGHTWDELVQLFKDKQLDILHTISKNKNREKFGEFLFPYIKLKTSLILNKNQNMNISTLSELNNKKIALIKNYDIDNFITLNYPKINRVYVRNSVEALKQLSTNKVDAYIERTKTFQYLKKEHQFNDLVEINNINELNKNFEQSFYVMGQKNNTILNSILTKAYNALQRDEIENLDNKWFGKETSVKILPYKQLLQKAISSQSKTTATILEVEGIEYFTYIARLNSISSSNEYLSVLIPLEQIMAPYLNKIFISLFITFGILLLTIPLIWMSTKFISDPFVQLEEENQKIINREFNKVQKIDTFLNEVSNVSNSLVDMSKSIQKYQQEQKDLMDSFIKILASSIDYKSNYTGKHCEQVPILTMMIANEASKSENGSFKDFKIETKDQKRELSIAAWLHDCGKITTPEYVVDKATKLETIYNRIHEIRTRFEVVLRDYEIEYYKKLLNNENEKNAKLEFEKQKKQLQDDFTLVAKANVGAESTNDEIIKRIHEIANITWQRNFDARIGLSQEEENRLENKDEALPITENLLKDKSSHIIKRPDNYIKQYKEYNFKLEVPENLYNFGEVYNLCIKYGTLTPEERFKINEHIMMTIKMLEELPFPTTLKKVPEYAGSHHETLNGKGYPRKYTKEQMSLPARIIALCDVFEALSSNDRPYKKTKTLSQCIDILYSFVQKEHLDREVFELFLESGIYKQYANEYLIKEQIDEVDISKYIDKKLD